MDSRQKYLFVFISLVYTWIYQWEMYRLELQPTERFIKMIVFCWLKLWFRIYSLPFPLKKHLLLYEFSIWRPEIVYVCSSSQLARKHSYYIIILAHNFLFYSHHQGVRKPRVRVLVTFLFCKTFYEIKMFFFVLH